MSDILYLECTNGISGDMFVGALLDLGAEEEELKKKLATLPLSGYEIKIRRVKKAGLDMCDFDVVLDEEHENHDHDIAYLYGHKNGETCAEEEPGGNHQAHRGMKEIREVFRGSALTDEESKKALHIFQILAEAEAKVHGESVDSVHFHEVGAVDSIVDIAAAAICLTNLGITEVVVPTLTEGTGTVRCQHGILPVPVPAVLEIVRAHEIPLETAPVEAELVTPTGAAIVAAIRTQKELPARYQVVETGMGSGKRDYGRDSILRVMRIRPEVLEAPFIYKLETNIDDSTGEALGYTMEQLLKAGALDVYDQPIFMKKNRPAYQLNVLCEEDQIPVMEEIIFRETTTLGIRRVKMQRTTLPRQTVSIPTPYGDAQVKLCTQSGQERATPEYASVKRICEENQLPFLKVYEEISALAQDAINRGDLPPRKC